MPNITGHTELVGLMAYPIRHTQSPTTHNLAYDKNGDDVIQLAFEVDNDTLEAAVESIRALMLMCGKVTQKNLIDNSPLFRKKAKNLIEISKIFWYNKDMNYLILPCEILMNK